MIGLALSLSLVGYTEGENTVKRTVIRRLAFPTCEP